MRTLLPNLHRDRQAPWATQDENQRVGAAIMATLDCGRVVMGSFRGVGRLLHQNSEAWEEGSEKNAK
jgi:hypothetical protein